MNTRSIPTSARKNGTGLMLASLLLVWVTAGRAAAEDRELPLPECVTHLEKGSAAEALSCLNQSLARAEEAGDLLLQASLHYHRGIALTYLGNLEEARQQYRRAILIAENIGNLALAVKVRNRSGQTLNRLGRYGQAIDELSKAERDAENLGPAGKPMHCLRATILGNRATSHYHRGEFPLAVEQFLRAEALFEKGGDATGLLITRIHMANTLLNLGRLKEAVSVYQKAAGQAKDMGNGKKQADALSGLSLAYQYEGRQQQALQALGEALEIHLAAEDGPGAARDRNNLGLVYENLKEYEAAQTNYAGALRDFHALEMTEEQGIAWANLGYVALLRNEPEEAGKCLSHALEILEQCQCPKSRSLTYEYMGRLLLHQGQNHEAISYFKKSRDLAQEMARPETTWRALAGLGEARAAMGQRQAALDCYRKAVHTIEQIRQDMIEPQYRDQYLYDKLHVYNALIRIFLEMNNKYDALQSLEQRRRWWLRAKLRGGTIPFQDDRRKALCDEERTLFTKTRALEKNIGKEKESPGPDDERLKQLLSQWTAAKQEHQESLKALKNQDPVLYSRLSSERFDLQGFVHSLPEDAAVIAYFLDEEDLISFSLTSEGLEVASFPGARSILEEKTAALRKAVSSPPANLPRTRDAFLEASFTLHQVLIKPLSADVHGKKHWYILPDDMLWAVPFAAIARPSDPGVRYLVDDHVTMFVNALGELPARERGEGPKTRHGPDRVVAFGNPQGTLPAAEKEIGLARTIHPEARIFSGKLASEPNVRRYARDADILIFAAHAFRPGPTEVTYISLALSEGDDGRLSVNEIRGLDLKGVKLVVLSGCSTALAHDQGEGFLSLSDAFLFAGADSVIATLWDVSDQGTFELMEHFIEHFRKNLDHEEALRLAQTALLDGNVYEKMPFSASSVTRGARYVPFAAETGRIEGRDTLVDLSHPYYWAPFIIIKFGLNSNSRNHY